MSEAPTYPVSVLCPGCGDELARVRIDAHTLTLSPLHCACGAVVHFATNAGRVLYWVPAIAQPPTGLLWKMAATDGAGPFAREHTDTQFVAPRDGCGACDLYAPMKCGRHR